MARLEQVTGSIMGMTICALGDAAAMPVQSFVKKFRDEFVQHVEERRCPFGEHGLGARSELARGGAGDMVY